MLVLSRKINESLNIGDSIVVTVLELKGNNVRIGIVAPDEIKILRSEIIERDAARDAQLDQTLARPGTSQVDEPK